MAAFDLPLFARLGDNDIARFRRDGFLIVERFLSEDRVAALRESFPKLFAGKFDTGVYPDRMVLARRHEPARCDAPYGECLESGPDHRQTRALGRSRARGIRAGRLVWRTSRQDTIWWKMPKTKPIAHHQDSSFMDFLNPSLTVTCWVTLDDTHPDAGTLEYAPGSHLWPLTALPESFHGQGDYRAQMKAAAQAAGVVAPEPFPIEVPAGSCVFHAGEVWHGSGPNRTGDRMRRSVGVHLIPEDAQFSDRPGGYIYRRYQRTGDPALDESFFPILWSKDGRRTQWIERYCDIGRRLPAPGLVATI